MKAQLQISRVLLLILFLFPARLFLAAQQAPCCPSDCEPGPNLVVNGNFSGPCFNGYGSDLTSFPCTATTFSSNAFTERNNAALVNPAWTGTERTGDGGRGLILDGPSSGSPRAWFQTVNVECGKTYCFTAWFLNICPTCPATPTFDIRINGQVLNTVALAHNGVWTRACITYTAAMGGPIELAILMRGVPGGGNDAMIDDISFTELQTNCCCRDITAEVTSYAQEPNLCCIRITLKAPGNCDLSAVFVDAPFEQKIIAWPGKLVFPLVLGPFCLPKPARFILKISFLDKCGKVVCVKPIDVACNVLTVVPTDDPSLKVKTAAEEIKEDRLEVFPNPASNSIILKMNNGGKPASGQAAIIDGSGRTVQQQRVTIPPENVTIDISALKPGAYFIRFTNDSGEQKKAAFIKN